MKKPKKAVLGWSSEIRNKNFILVLLELFVYYVVINFIFTLLYYKIKSLENSSFLDYVYFSFVTSLTIGFGDFVPVNILGKFLVIAQTCITALYFAMMVSVLSLKLLYPRDLIYFSEKVIYNSNSDMLIIRVINTNQNALVNPEIRISITEHNAGNESAGMFNIPLDYNLTYLGKYDFSYAFKNSYEHLNIMGEVNKAIKHNKTTEYFQSRFRINVSITGSYGFNQVALYKKYHANDIVIGKNFKPITYNKNFYSRKKAIKYNKIKNFWNDFEAIEKLDE